VQISQPHIVALVRPAVSRDSNTNATTKNYATPAPTASIVGMFQTRAGNVQQTDDGRLVAYDAMFYSNAPSTIPQVDDKLTVSFVEHSQAYIVLAVDAKYDLAGRFSHYQCLLQRETRQ